MITRTIWKFALQYEDLQTVMMPAGAEIISVQNQADVVCVWAIVGKDDPKLPRKFRIIGTGHDVPAEDMEHLGTVQIGALVWHVFEVFS